MPQKPTKSIPKKSPQSAQHAAPAGVNLHQPLSPEELEQLDQFLASVDPDEAMTVSELDGYFCALISGPEPTPETGEYLPAVWGFVERPIFRDASHAQEVLSQLARHWNTIAAKLSNEEVYVPLLVEQEDGSPYVADWLTGFLQGMELRPAAWEKLSDDEERGPAMMPIIALLDELAHDHDDEEEQDHEEHAKMTPEMRAQAIDLLPSTLGFLYEIFREEGFAAKSAPAKKRGPRK